MMDSDDALGKTRKATKPRSRSGSNPLELSWLWVFVPFVALLVQAAPRGFSSWVESGSPLYFQLWIPFGAAFLVWAHREDWERTLSELKELFPDPNSSKRVGNLSLIFVGGLGLTISYLASMLPLIFFSLWLLVVGGIFYLYGPFLLRVVLRPLLFLLLAVPPPIGALSQLVSGFQVTSAFALGQFLQAVKIDVRISWKAITFVQGMKVLEISPSHTGLGVLFFVFSFAIFLTILRRTPISATLALLFLAIICAIVVNCLRLVLPALLTPSYPLLAEMLYRAPALPTLLAAVALLWFLGRRFIKPRSREGLAL